MKGIARYVRVQNHLDTTYLIMIILLFSRRAIKKKYKITIYIIFDLQCAQNKIDSENFSNM